MSSTGVRGFFLACRHREDDSRRHAGAGADRNADTHSDRRRPTAGCLVGGPVDRCMLPALSRRSETQDAGRHRARHATLDHDARIRCRAQHSQNTRPQGLAGNQPRGRKLGFRPFPADSRASVHNNGLISTRCVADLPDVASLDGRRSNMRRPTYAQTPPRSLRNPSQSADSAWATRSPHHRHHRSSHRRPQHRMVVKYISYRCRKQDRTRRGTILTLLSQKGLLTGQLL